MDYRSRLRGTIEPSNATIDEEVSFDPSIKGSKGSKGTGGFPLPKANRAQRIDRCAFKAHSVTGDIAFTYGGLKVGPTGSALREDGTPIEGLDTCSELVGVLFDGYPGGSGIISGAADRRQTS